MYWLKSSKRKLSVPDWLSVYRILSAPLLIVFILFNERMFFGIFLLISFLTDALDGFIARRMKIETQRGAQLDSIGDAVTFLVALVGVFKFEFDFIKEHIILIVLAFGLYVFQLFIAYWRYGMPSSFHTYLAKIAAVFQAIFMVWLFLVRIELWLFYITIILGIIETIEEIILIILFPKWKANVRGLLWVLIAKKK